MEISEYILRGGFYTCHFSEWLRSADHGSGDFKVGYLNRGFRAVLNPRRSISTKPGSDFP